MTKEEKEIILFHGTVKTHISDLKNGDVVIYNDSLKTVGRNDVKLDSFIGLCIFGDASKQYLDKVKFKQFPKWK